MFDKLKKLLEGGVAQVNPFDGGKTFQSVVNNRTPQQQNAVQQQARTFRPSQPSVAPQQTFTNKLRDILDANTEADKFRRAKLNQSTDYATQQREEYGVKRAPMNVGSQLFGNAARFANTAGAALGEIQDTSAVYGANLADAVTGGDQTSRVLQEVNKRQQARYNPKSGIFGAGTWFDNQEDFRKSTSNPLDLAKKAAVGTIGTAFEAGSMGAGQKVAKLADVGLKQFLARGGKAAAARAVEGVIADAASQSVERDNYSAAQGATAAVAGAGLPIVARGAAKVLRPVVGAASDALGRIRPRSVAEIAQEVNIARTAPAIAENAPAPSRVSGAPTPRPASEIAAELAASKARSIDPNVAARRASFSPTEQVAQIKRVNVSPDDQRILADFNDIANGVYKPDARLQRQIELDATRIAEKYNIPLRSTALETADEFDNFLQRGVTKPEFAPKPSRQTNQLAPKPSKTGVTTKLDIYDASKGESYGTIVATRNGKPVGKMDISTTNNGDVYVNNVDVPESLRRQGIATELYRKAQQESRSGFVQPTGQTELGAATRKSLESKGIIKSRPVAKVERPVPFTQDEWAKVNAMPDSAAKRQMVNKMNDYDSEALYWKGNKTLTKPVIQTTKSQPGVRDSLADGLPNQTGNPIISPAPQVGKTDPLEALKAEARKYKSADEFSRSYDAEELLYKKVASDISAQTPKELRVKPTSLGVLKGNLRGSWVDNGDAYTFYPKKSFSPDWEKELARVVPDAKVSSGAVDFPKSKYKSMNYEDLGTVYNQATKPKAYYQNVPKSYTEPRAKSEVELNTKRLNLTPEQASQLDPKVKSVVDRMSNDDVVRIAKSAGLDTKSYSPGETRVKIAEQLNVRQDAVRLMNEAEAARKAGNTDQAAELLKQAAEQGRISRTQGTDLARQLQARRIIANELDTPQQKVFKLFDEAGVNPDVYTKRLAGVDFSDSKQVVNAYRELVPAKAGQWLDTVRYNSMLSSPLTQAVNIFGNAQNVAGVAPIEKTIRGGIDSIAGLFGKERQYAAGEGASYLKGEVKALPKAAKSFVDALKGSGEYANQDFSDYNMPLATKGAAGKAYQALSFPMRVLDGMDKFFRTLASSGEEAALDKRVSKGIGLRGDKQSLIDQEAAYRVYQAEGHIPGQGKVLDAMDSVADLVMSGRNSKNPILSTISKFTVPFVKTVNNINKQGFIEYSPAGLLNLVGKEDKIDGITKAVMGTAVFGTSALLLKSGDMTWAEPRNAEERARFRAEGKQPYAIKMGDKWYNYSKLTPVVAFPMAMTAALDDAFNKGKADQSFIDKTLTAFAKYGNFMSDQSYAKSIGDTLGAIGGDEEAIARMVSNQWQQVVPARALTGWLARMTDDVERKVDTTQGYFDQQVQAFMQQYPGLRQKTPTRDYQGQPIAANNQVLNAFSPVRVTNDRGVSPLDAEQDAIKLATDKAELLDKRQLKEVDNRSADKIREAQKQLISQPGWNELTAEEKKSGLSRLESDIKAVEKLQYQADNHVGEYSGSYTGKSTKLTANQKTLVNDGVKLSKYVGKSDSTEAKTNKEKYEKAFEDFNDPDNGYSRVEKVKKREELKRLTVQKDYDEDTTMLHGMSKEDVWGFLSTYEDGKAMADKLLALDDALTAAGVQDKNKFRDKYGNITIKPKEKSSGGSKAKTVKGQAEAVSSERKLRALLANTNNKASYRKPATQSAKVGLKKFAVKSAGLTSKKGA